MFEEILNKVFKYDLQFSVKKPVCGGQEYSVSVPATKENYEELLKKNKTGILEASGKSMYDDTCYFWIDLANHSDWGGWLKKAHHPKK